MSWEIVKRAARRSTGIFAIWFLAALSAATSAKEIGILADRSMSVEPSNRSEAVDLIAGLLTGQVTAQSSERWHLITQEADYSDPDLWEYHEQETAHLTRLLEGESREGLALAPHNLFLGEFGDLSTVQALESVEWNSVGKTDPGSLSNWSAAITSSDKETHLDLARATAASRLRNKDSFYLFVVSDGIEDLVNWPVSKYLDADKCSDVSALAKGDFRDSAKARTLETLNFKRKRGEDVKISSRVSAGYDTAARKRIDDFRSSFSERLLGRISLKSANLASFFETHPGKVPVSILIYSAEPKRSVSIRFSEPDSTSPDRPNPVNPEDCRMSWRENWSNGTADTAARRVLSIHEPGTDEALAEREVTSESIDLFEAFPNLPEGKVEVRISLFPKAMKPVRSSAYVQWNKASPQLEFTDKWADRNTARSAWVFDPRRDRDILNTPVHWKWTSDRGEPSPPHRLIRTLSQFDPETVDEGVPEYESKTEVQPPHRTTAPLSKLFTSDGESAEPLPLRGLYRLKLTGEWKDGARAEEEAWFELPEPRLIILGQSEDEGSESSPRKVSTGEIIKVGNWMHDWRGFDYDLLVEREEDDDWSPVSQAESPLKLVRSGNEIGVEVVAPPSGKTRFEITFGPELSQDRELVEVTTVAGFVAPQSSPLLPWVLGACLALTLGLFTWNFVRKN